jgi:Lar family restriction alleviation protein
MAEIKLKPCPFCGERAELHKNVLSETYSVECKRCAAKVIGCETSGKAFEMWNRRLTMEHKVLGDIEGISISVDGNKVIAKRGNKVGIAKCSPEDEFDIFTGAKIALDRLEKISNPYPWLKKGLKYYLPAPWSRFLYDMYRYNNDEVDKRFISRGLVFKTREEAIEVAKKMLAVIKEG